MRIRLSRRLSSLSRVDTSTSTLTASATSWLPLWRDGDRPGDRLGAADGVARGGKGGQLLPHPVAGGRTGGDVPACRPGSRRRSDPAEVAGAPAWVVGGSERENSSAESSLKNSR